MYDYGEIDFEDDYSSLCIFPSTPPPKPLSPSGSVVPRGEPMQISPGFAKLTNTQLNKVQKLEKDLDMILIAHEKIPVISDLSREEVRVLQDMEKRMGITLVAYRPE
jgi:hypothetical protein